MARSEARIYTEIWDDEDFLAVSPTAQRLFLFLVSQKDLAHDGVIALRERRWSKKAPGLTTDGIAADLKELEANRFVVVDEDTEELLIRSFIRRDKVYRQPNVLRAAADHLPLVSSRVILAAIHHELLRVVEEGGFGEASARILEEMVPVAAKGFRNPTRKGSEEGSDIPSGNPTEHLPGERGVVTVVTTDIPVPRSSDSPLPGMPAASLGRAEANASQPDRFGEFYAAYPRKRAPEAARRAWDKAIKVKADPSTIIAGAKQYAAERAGKDPQYTSHPATWLNAKGWLNEPDRPAQQQSEGNGRRVSSPEELEEWDQFLAEREAR